MKYSPLLPQVALVFAAAYACTDSTAPANSHALLAPSNPTGQFGEPPPPPVDVAITVTINSPEQAVFTGVYFSKGILDEVGTPFETIDGTAWLRFDNEQPNLGGTASANTRFMVKGEETPTGKGTLFIGGTAFTIVSVQSFTRFTSCEAGSFSPCVLIRFTVSDGENEHMADLLAFDRETCLENVEGVSNECPFPPPDDEIG